MGEYGDMDFPYSKEMKHLLSCMLKVEPEHRKTAQSILLHPLLAGSAKQMPEVKKEEITHSFLLPKIMKPTDMIDQMLQSPPEGAGTRQAAMWDQMKPLTRELF